MNKEDLESKLDHLNQAMDKFTDVRADEIKAWGQIADAADADATALIADAGSYHAMVDRAVDRSLNSYFPPSSPSYFSVVPSSISYSGPDPEERTLDEIGEMIGARKAFAAKAKGGFELLEAVLEMTAEPHLFFSSPRFTAYGEDYSLSVRLSMQSRLFASELFRAPDRLFLTGYLQRVDEFLVSENREMSAMGWTLDEGVWTKGVATRGGVKKAVVSLAFRNSPGLCFSLGAGGPEIAVEGFSAADWAAAIETGLAFKAVDPDRACPEAKARIAEMKDFGKMKKELEKGGLWR